MKGDILYINQHFSGPDEEESDNDTHDTSSDYGAAEEQEADELGDAADSGSDVYNR